MTKQIEKYFKEYLGIIRNNNHQQLHEVFENISLPIVCKYDFILDMKAAMHGTHGTIIRHTKNVNQYWFKYWFTYGFMYRYKTNVYFCFVRTNDKKHRYVTCSIIEPKIVRQLIADNIISEEFAYE